MGYESWSPELQGSAQSRPIPLGPEHAGTMVPALMIPFIYGILGFLYY